MTSPQRQTPLSMVSAVEQRRLRFAQLQRQITPQAAQAMRGLAAENPSLSAGALFGMGMAGVQPGTPAAKAAYEADQQVQTEKGNWFKRAISVTYKGIKAGGGAILPDVVGDTVNAISPALKGVSRGADVGLSAPGQLLQGWVRSGRANNGDLGFDDLVSRNTWREAAEQTDLRQAHEHIQERGGYLGLATGSTDVDYGSGFFSGGEVGRRAGVEKQAATPERIDGKLPTIGRLLAREVGFEPGNTAYNVMSGLTDAAVMLGTDPTSLLGVSGGRTVAARAARESFSGDASKGFDAAAAAAKVDEGLVATRSQQVDVTGLDRDQILAQAGALTGIRNTVNSDRALEWLTTSRQGTTVVEYLSKLGPNDFEKAWKATKGKVPADVLLQLTNREMTKDEVIAILGPTLGRTKTTGDKFGVDSVGQAQAGMATGVSGLGTLATAKFKQSIRSVRAFGAMPERVLRKDDLDETLRNAHEFMNTALLEDTDVIKRGDRLVHRSDIMRRLAEINGEEGMLEVAEDMMALGASKAMSEFGIPAGRAEELFRLYSEQTTANRLYWQQQVVVDGEKAWVNRSFSRPGEKPTFKGSEETRPVPHLAAQFLDNSIPLPDVREIRREMSRYRNILSLPGVQPSLTTLNKMQESIFKPFVLLRPAFTVRNQIDEQFRPAGVGMASLFSHPVQYLQWVMDDTQGVGRMLAKASGGRFASRGQTFGPEGQAFDEFGERTRMAREAYKDAQRSGDLDLIAETKAAYEQAKSAVQSVTPFSDEVSEYTRAATGGAGNWRNMGYAQVNGNQVFRLEDTDYSRALGEGLHLLYNDPLVRRIVLGEDIEQIKQDWWQGALGNKYRVPLAQRDERMSYLNDEIGAARYVEDTVEFMRQFVGDSPELREAVRTGKIGGVPLTQGDTLTISARAIQKLDELKQVEGYQGPSGVIGSRVIKGGEDVSRWDQATNAMFYRLADQPTRVLARSPVFRQRYYKRMEDLIGFMDDKAATAAIAAAQKAKLPAKDVKRLQSKRKAGGTLTWVEADLVAKGDALDFTNKLFYSLHHRNQFLDAARLIFPFGEAFKNSAVTYGKIVAENPVLPYRLTQIIEGGRDADLNGDGKGFFYTDEQTGEEMFGFPGSATLLRAVGLGGAGQLRAPVGNLNILGTSVVPGFGPAVQLSAAAVLPDEEDFNGVREFLSPYGDRTVEGGAFESFFPAWLQKWRTATGLASPAQQRAFANSTKDWMGYLASTGDYNLQDPEGQRQLLSDAKSKARATWFVRGMAQFVAPSPPSPEFVAYDKDGTLLTQFKLAEEYRRIQKENEEAGTPEATDRIFIETFGEQAVLAIIPNTKPGEDRSPLPPNRKALEFYQRNKGAAQRFPGVFGLFAPDPEAAEFDFVTYNRQLSSGERVVISPEEAVKRANQKVARMIVNQANTAIEQVAPRGEDGRPKPTKEQREALAALKAKLSEDFPGYSVAFSNDTPALLEDLKRAAKDPELGKTPAGEALNVYLQARDMAEQAAQAQYGTGWRQSNKAAAIRSAMRVLGERLSDDFEGFRNIYERVLEREMAQDDPVAPEQEAVTVSGG